MNDATARTARPKAMIVAEAVSIAPEYRLPRASPTSPRGRISRPTWSWRIGSRPNPRCIVSRTPAQHTGRLDVVPRQSGRGRASHPDCRRARCRRSSPISWGTAKQRAMIRPLAGRDHLRRVRRRVVRFSDARMTPKRPVRSRQPKSISSTRTVASLFLRRSAGDLTIASDLATIRAADSPGGRNVMNDVTAPEQSALAADHLFNGNCPQRLVGRLLFTPVVRAAAVRHSLCARLVNDSGIRSPKHFSHSGNASGVNDCEAGSRFGSPRRGWPLLLYAQSALPCRHDACTGHWTDLGHRVVFAPCDPRRIRGAKARH
jgi:hypothetical protein